VQVADSVAAWGLWRTSRTTPDEIYASIWSRTIFAQLRRSGWEPKPWRKAVGKEVEFMLDVEESSDGRKQRNVEDPPIAGVLFQSSGPVTWLWLVVRAWLGSQWLLLGWAVLAQPPADANWTVVLSAVAHGVLGVALIAGAFVGIAASAGVIENVLAYAIPGGSDGDPLELIAATLLILAWKNAGYLGMDRYLLRLFGAPWWDTRVPHVSARARRAAPKRR
jgi:thiosulfate dehydrogenase (quinone) large subunit